MAILHQMERKSLKGKIIYAIFVIFLVIYLPVQVLPMLYTFLCSLMTGAEISSAVPNFIPKVPQWYIYVKIFQTDFTRNILNSFYLCATIILTQVTISALAAYVLAILKPKGSRIIFLIFTGTLMISAPAILFPLYVMTALTGLVNTFASVILPCMAYAYTILLFKGFFQGIPFDLIEAAEIDGAGYLYIFGKIIVPISKPVFVVNIITTFMGVYNDVGMHSMFLQAPEKRTLMVAMYELIQHSANTDPSIPFAMSMVSIIPVILIYSIFQKYIAQGITMTGLKG